MTKNQDENAEIERIANMAAADAHRALAATLAAQEAPALTARDALAPRDPLRIWAQKCKAAGGEIEAWLCQDVNEIVLSHTLPSGRYSIFAKVAK